MLQAAIDKITEGLKGKSKMGWAAQAMAGPVAEQLIDFCRQDAEFAQAVVEGGSFAGCMAAVGKNCGSVLSDLEAYRRAVQFYFPGAGVRSSITIDLYAGIRGDDAASKSGDIIDLTLFL